MTTDKNVQNEVEVNKDLIAELDEMNMFPPADEQDDTNDKDQVNEDEENSDENEETSEDSESEEDQNEEVEDEESTDDESGEEEQDQEEEDETGADDQDETSDDNTVDLLRTQINDLNQTILDLQSGKQKTTEEETSTEEPKPEASKVPVTDLKFDKDYDFFQGEDADEVHDDPKKFNKCLMDFANQVSQKTVTQMMLTVPEVIKHQAKEELMVQKAVGDFYAENEDLKPLKATVAQVCNKIASEHSDYTIEEVFKEAAIRTRKMLNLVKKHKQEKKKQTANNLETDPNKANIGKPKGKKQKKKKASVKTPLQRELDEMNDFK